MEDPRKEIAHVVKGLCSAKDANQQRDTIQTYFTADASFDHPMCSVASYPNSRDTGVLPIYQWLRIMFMDTLIDVHDIGLDPRTNKLFIKVTQTLRCNLALIRCLWAPTVALVVELDLVKGKDQKYYIARQVDYYQIQEVLYIVFPFAKKLVVAIKLFTGFLCMIFALLFQLLGFWSLSTSKP
ncbi:hypothetical protein MYAM1_001241 [Malassezia yamatoensis]|uniref:SigF-like NTF2-like domain-containing protein n=1 Tax=Malassezia yamatoensis TaxID=253288 RepID=A0AAJ5YSJ8_9BASI|nr:hypothetical protein MYAM1_001241 [Malassezia yamatoensis]